MPDTRPDQIFDDNGICNACLSFSKNNEINWSERENELNEIIDEAKKEVLVGIALFHLQAVRIALIKLFGLNQKAFTYFSYSFNV